MLLGSAFADIKLSVDIDTDKVSKYADMMDEWEHENQSDIQETSQAVIEFNNLATEYAHEVQAESNRALKPLVNDLEIITEVFMPNDETCDAKAFAECLTKENVYQTIVWPDAFTGACADQTGCSLNVLNMNEDQLKPYMEAAEKNDEEIEEFAEEITGNLNSIAMNAIMKREQAIRNVTVTFSAKLGEIAQDLECNPQCVDNCY